MHTYNYFNDEKNHTNLFSLHKKNSFTEPPPWDDDDMQPLDDDDDFNRRSSIGPPPSDIADDDDPPPPSDDDSSIPPPTEPPSRHSSMMPFAGPPMQSNMSTSSANKRLSTSSLGPPDDDDINDDDDALGPPGESTKTVTTSTAPGLPPPDLNLQDLSLGLNMNASKRSSLLIPNVDSAVAAGVTVTGNKEEPVPVQQISPSSEISPSDMDKVSPSNTADRSDNEPKGDDSEVQLDEHELIEQGFVTAEGKFEGDDFETLYIRCSFPLIQIKVKTGETIELDITTNSYVSENPSENLLILDNNGTLFHFKFTSGDDLTKITQSLPKSCFNKAAMHFSDDDSNKSKGSDEDEDDHSLGSKSSFFSKGSNFLEHARRHHNEKQNTFKSFSPFSMDKKNPTSVEHILEGSDDLKYALAMPPSEPPPDEEDVMLFPPPPTPMFVKSHRRKELVDDHIKKAKYSVRRVKQLCMWINSMHLWSNTVDILSLHQEMCTGLLLARIMKAMVPSASFVSLNQKARTEKMALENLEQALGFIWRCKSLNTSRIPSAKEIYSGSISKISILLQEIFEVYVVKPLFKNAIKILRWFHSYLSQYNRPLPAAIFEEGDLAGVWSYFQSGTSIFCIIYHLFGPVMIGEGATTVKIDPMRIVSEPCSLSDFRSNVSYVWNLLRALKIEIIWDVEDWITFPDTEFVVLQLSIIYDAMKHRKCSLPPAQGNVAGVTSGPNGKPIVVGLSFADSLPVVNATKAFRRTKKTVLLGDSDADMPLLPIEYGGKKGRFFSTVCPPGLVASTVRVVQQPIEVTVYRETLETRDSWNESVNYEDMKKSGKQRQLLETLRGQSKAVIPFADTHLHAHNVSNQIDLHPMEGAHSATANVSATPTKQKSIIDTLREGGNKSPESPSSPEQSTLELQVAKAIEQLEKSIADTTKEFDKREEELADRYLDLEARCDDLDEEEYGRLLDELELEAKRLDDERIQMDEHFSMCRSSINAQHHEATLRGQAAMLQASATKQQQGTESSVTKQNTPFKKTPKKSDVKKKAEEERNAKLEKGFIIVPMKNELNTVNYHLKKITTAQSENLKQSWSTKKSKSKEKERQLKEKMESLSRSGSDGINLIDPRVVIGLAENLDQNPDAVFQRFKAKLHMTTNKWLLDRQQVGRDKMIDLLTASGGYSPSKGTWSPNGSSKGGNNGINVPSDIASIGAAIREQETRLMQYEDERRRLVLKEQSLQFFNMTTTSRASSASDDIPQQQKATLQTTSSSPTHRKMKGNGSGGSAGFNSLIPPQPTSAEIDASFKWLSILRPLKLADRSKKEYMWGVVKERGSVSDKVSYVLQWREPAQQQSLVGSVVINDVKDIICDTAHDPTLITLIVGESTKALKNSGGRTQVAFNCTSASEAGKFLVALQCLRHSSSMKNIQ